MEEKILSTMLAIGLSKKPRKDKQPHDNGGCGEVMGVRKNQEAQSVQEAIPGSVSIF